MNRRTSFYLGLVFVFGLYLFSCNEKTDEPFVETLEINPETLGFTLFASADAFTVTSNTKWTTRVDSDAEWLSISPALGEGNRTITVLVDGNSTPDIREALIIVETEGGLSESIVISQLGITPNIIVSTQNVTADAEGEQISITVTATGDWEVEIPTADKEWISSEKTSTQATLNVFPNVTDNSRSTIIVFKLVSKP